MDGEPTLLTRISALHGMVMKIEYHDADIRTSFNEKSYVELDFLGFAVRRL